MCQFKNNENATDIAKKISSVYDQGEITNHQIWKYFSKFRSSDWKMNPDQNPIKPRSSCFKRISGM